jgi:hypothetical protein
MNLSGLEDHVIQSQRRKPYVVSTLQELEGPAEIKGWPEQPRKLRDRTTLSVFFGFSEILITLAPVAFIGKMCLHKTIYDPNWL